MIDLVNGDCWEVLKSFEYGCVDLIVTDPPYTIPRINGGGSVNNTLKMNYYISALKENQDITTGYDIERFADEVVRLQGGDVNAYFWCNKLQIPDYFRVYVDKLKCKFDILCWHKTNCLPTYSNKYLADTEYCLFFHKGKGRTHPKCFNDAKTYWEAPLNQTGKKNYNHPTIKPLNMIERLVINSSQEGDVVLDPFMGSGTTGVACLKNNRNFIGIELNEEYFKVAQRRINDAKSQLSLF